VEGLKSSQSQVTKRPAVGSSDWLDVCTVKQSTRKNFRENYMSYKSRFELGDEHDAIIAVWLHGLRQNEGEE
jgi:hypothetical protein